MAAVFKLIFYLELNFISMSQSSEINGLFEKFFVKLTYHKTSRCQSALHCQGSLNLIQNVTKMITSGQLHKKREGPHHHPDGQYHGRQLE